MTTSPNTSTHEAKCARVEALLTRAVRPIVAADGGEVTSRWNGEAQLVVTLGGACLGCPGRPYTVARLIEPLLRQELGPDIAISFEGA